MLLKSTSVDRKLVKQTVMTSVYGVTFIGARAQARCAVHAVHAVHAMLCSTALCCMRRCAHASCAAPALVALSAALLACLQDAPIKLAQACSVALPCPACYSGAAASPPSCCAQHGAWGMTNTH